MGAGGKSGVGLAVGFAEVPLGVLAGCGLWEESAAEGREGLRAELLRLLPDNPTAGAARRAESAPVGVGVGVDELVGCRMCPVEAGGGLPAEVLLPLPKNWAAFSPSDTADAAEGERWE